jgi:hypothetical protein
LSIIVAPIALWIVTDQHSRAQDRREVELDGEITREVAPSECQNFG